MRPSIFFQSPCSSIFQSTHPHGVRPMMERIQPGTQQFQSTHPHGVRLLRPHVVGEPLSISIHAPARGATADVRRFVLYFQISIHAPARGATKGVDKSRSADPYFNPRTRTGCDSLSTRCRECCQKFQSTHPHGVRLPHTWRLIGDIIISIHAPARGATADIQINVF